MKYKLLILFIVLVSCTQLSSNYKVDRVYNAKGFAYIFNENDYLNKVIKKKLNNENFEISHNKLRVGTLIKLINPKTKDSIILKNTKKINYPDFYKILITKPVAKKLNLKNDLPLIEIIEIKKNKSFIAKKTKIFNEEKKIHSKAPVELVKIDNISKNKNKINALSKDKFYILIGEFYSKNSALMLRDRIIKQLTKFDENNLSIKVKKINKISLISGPYKSINLMKNDYILLKDFGFEELDISINE